MLIYWNMELPLKATSSFGMVDSRPCKKRKDGAPDLLLGSRRSKARPPAGSGGDGGNGGGNGGGIGGGNGGGGSGGDGGGGAGGTY